MHRAAIHKPKADSSVKVDCHALLYAKARNDRKKWIATILLPQNLAMTSKRWFLV
ncbi:hypothetical protein [Helicobacter zhangjianzhongii]|uniref:Uncharacterized protein n=1 Tax=Helicobacter zhangjianzhongii TaxID=2974574 RepID=A0ACC6FTB1_9HELI|nr:MULTISPECIES: hypothetical protein [unclassified Helicobacter]MDL0080333.1 hypothetical protein [Helicobacter sp. CPD2-1]MDL0082519.1 hypothetical protein [Helicobacter sp. XJK30-2]